MNGIELTPLLIGLLGGLAVFLFGLELMTDALKSVAGSGMSTVLSRLTRNRFMAAGTGAFVTAVIQSSSVTTVLVVGFISAGLMTLPQSIGVIMGANIGTTVTAQIVAFKITKYALVFIALGFAGTFLSKRKSVRCYGFILMGLGLIFLGMGFMSDATDPLRTYAPFVEAMQRMSNPLLGILAAAAFTALVQSSSATTGIVIVLASQGFITLEAGIALAFGANIGTCVTAGLASLGKPREAKQAALVHLLFNAIGVLIWLPFIEPLAGVVRSFSPHAADLAGAERLASEAPRQIANAHTVFNLANTLIFIWFTGPLASLVTRLLPRKPEPVSEFAQPRFLQDEFLNTPSIAMDQVRLEIQRFGRDIARLMSEQQPAWRVRSVETLDRVVQRTGEHERLYDAINAYIRELSARNLSKAETQRLAGLTAFASHAHNVAEVIAVNQVAIGRERLERRVAFSQETQAKGAALHAKVQVAFDLAVASLEEPALAKRVVGMKSEIRALVDDAVEHLAARLVSSDPHRTVLYRLETQSFECLQREYYFAKRMAKVVLQLSDDSIETGIFEDGPSAGTAP